MSFCISSTPSKGCYSSDINLSISDSVGKHRSISLTTKKLPTNLNNFGTNSKFMISTILEPNKFTNIKTFSHKFKKVANDNMFSTLPKVSIDLNETQYLKPEEVTELRNKLKELTNDKVKLINKNYIKELKTLREIIDTIVNTTNVSS